MPTDRQFFAADALSKRWPIIVSAVLTFGAGALDVFALTHLGSVFASVMTGNLALMGLGIAQADVATLVHTALAVGSYVVGVAVGARTTGTRAPDDAAWPRRVTATLAIQLLLEAALFVGWGVAHAAPAGGVQLALLAAAASSMGLQSAAVRGLGVPLATTYLTGTLTGLIAASAGGVRKHRDAAGIAALVAAVAGAACSGLMLMTAPTLTPVLFVVPVAAVVVTAEVRRRI